MIVVSDTSPIRALCHLELASILGQIFDEVLIPPAVALELSSPRPRFVPVDIEEWEFLRVEVPPNQDVVRTFSSTLDLGESEAFALALERKADAVLIDEKAGRSEARRLGLQSIGTLGILIRAKRDRLIDSVATKIDRLQDELGFFVSNELRQQILQLAGES